jgi:hypothetical protein
MELDDFRQRWINAEPERSLRFNAGALRAASLGKAGTAMRKLSRFLVLELVLDCGAALWLGSFIADHLAQPRFVVPAAALDLGAIALMIAAIHQLVAINKVDYSERIIAIQKSLGSLRVLRLRTLQLVLVLAPLAWVPLLVVRLEDLFGVDAYAVFDRTWLLATVLFGRCDPGGDLRVAPICRTDQRLTTGGAADPGHLGPQSGRGD